MHNFKNKSAIVGHTQHTKLWETKQIPNHLLSLKNTLSSMSYIPCSILSDACSCYQIMGFFVRDWNQVGLPCAAKSDTLSAFLSCLFISVSHPKPLRRLLHRRSPWPWPTMATWICNQAAIPHKDALSLGQTPDCIQIVVYCRLGVTICCSGNCIVKMQQTDSDDHTWFAAEGQCSPELSSPQKRRDQSRTWWKWDRRSLGKNGLLVSFLNCLQCERTVEALFCQQHVTRTSKRQRQSGSTGVDFFCVSRIRGTTWLFVLCLCREGDETSRVSSHSWHSKTEQQNIWHLTLSHQCWIFVKENVTRLLGKQTAFFWIFWE